MNLAQLIDPERALAQIDRKSRAAELPSIRTHLLQSPPDARHAPETLGHMHQPTAGDGTSLRTLKALIASPSPLHSKQLAALLNFTPQKASSALTNLAHTQCVLRVGDKRPYLYKPTAKGRAKCA